MGHLGQWYQEEATNAGFFVSCAMRAGQSVNARLPGELIDHGKGIAASV
ncbi:MAG: hypothetical protein V5B35_16820 [Candidatus Accumulibacter necessarius]|jgi:hypothetical protein